MKKKSTIYQLTTCALMTALMCILAPNSVPIGPIPVSLTNLVIYLTVFLLGFKGSTIATVLYLLLGLVGLPVFSGYEGGPGKLVGPTGGYLIGFIFVAVIGGLAMDLSQKVKLSNKLATHVIRIAIVVVALVVGTAVEYLFGTAWFVHQAQCDWAYALSVCVFPFIPFDLAKLVIATILGKAVREALVAAHLI